MDPPATSKVKVQYKISYNTTQKRQIAIRIQDTGFIRWVIPENCVWRERQPCVVGRPTHYNQINESFAVYTTST